MPKLPNINIIYEDNHIIVVEKKPNILVQKDNTNDICLTDIIKDYIKIKYNKPGNVYLGLVHRLDRPVGGIMVFAKTSKAAERLSKSIQNKEITKIYYAVVEGTPNKEGTFKDYIIKDNNTNTSHITSKDKGKIAILNYTTIATINNMSLVKINLITGRSHQIRVQFSYHNNPLIGDQRYNKKATPNLDIALFAKILEFTHPVTKEKLHFELDLPDKYPFNLFQNI